jgi:hypothetical protein
MIHAHVMGEMMRRHPELSREKAGSLADSFIRGIITPFSAVGKLASFIPGVGKVLGPVGSLLPNAVTALTGVKPLI